MKYCKDCKHCLPTDSEGRVVHLCRSSLGTDFMTHDMVTGEIVQYLWSCRKARYDDDLCGSQARYYEPITPHTEEA